MVKMTKTNANESAQVYADIFNALSSRARIRILEEVLSRPVKVTELAQLCNITPQAIQKHIKILREAGLVETKKELHAAGKPLTVYPSQKNHEIVFSILKTEKTLIKKIDNLLSKANVKYVKNPSPVGSVYCAPDFIIPSLKNPKVAIEVKTFESDKLKLAAFESMELKKTYNGLKFVIVVAGAHQTEDKVFVKLKEAGYFDAIFFEDQLDQLVEYIRREAGEKQI